MQLQLKAKIAKIKNCVVLPGNTKYLLGWKYITFCQTVTG